MYYFLLKLVNNLMISNLLIMSLFTFSSANLVNLDENNLITVKGTIGKDISNKFFNDLKNFNEDRLDIFISSPGGSVLEGMKMIDYIKTLQNSNVEVNCYGDFAASMAFVILQSCTNRYALESSVLMQHQMSLGVSGPIENIKSYFKMIQDMENKLNHDQAKRIGLTDEEFDRKIFNDWWVSGITAKQENVVDDIIDLKCSPKLFKSKNIVNINTIFGKVKYTFSNCPLIRNPLNIDFSDYNGNIDIYENYFDTNYYIESLQK